MTARGRVSRPRPHPSPRSPAAPASTTGARPPAKPAPRAKSETAKSETAKTDIRPGTKAVKPEPGRAVKPEPGTATRKPAAKAAGTPAATPVATAPGKAANKSAGRSAARPKAGAGGRRGGPGLRVPLPGGGDKRLRLTRRGLVLALIMFALSATSVYPLRLYVIQQQRIGQLEAKQEALNAEVARLEQEKARLRDPEYVEQLAREELQMAKPGEETYVMSGQPPADRPPPDGPEPPPRPWYLRLWDGLMGRAG